MADGVPVNEPRSQEQAQALEKLGLWVVRTARRLMSLGPAQRWEIHIHAKGNKITASYTVYEDHM